MYENKTKNTMRLQTRMPKYQQMALGKAFYFLVFLFLCIGMEIKAWGIKAKRK